MPGIVRQYTPSTSSESYGSAASEENVGFVADHDYPALEFQGYAEKPLSEQLTPIAVIGMACRLPGDVSSPAQFWDMMINKKTGRTEKVPDSRFNIDAHLHENNERPGSFNVPGGYFLNSSLQEFDPALFNISPIEAMWMDPQQRKLLEVVYEAFENGGIPISTVENTNTAVYIGSFTSDFQQMSFKEPDFRHSYAATGVDPGIISNRISHVFNLRGPSITVNTACSSSVYAIHHACNALRNKECNGAVVGGSNLVLTVDQHMNTAKLGVLSPDSTCHTFDASCNGYGRADGVGAVYLKRLSDAVRDGDAIRGVLRSSAVNSNGKAPAVGITHPNLEGQAAVIRHAYKRGGDLDPRLTGYFECHGTGTQIGDPLEVHAVSQAMNKKGIKRSADPCSEALWIGAVKTNIGHSEAASGLSAIIKACLTVENGVIPPTRGVVNPNPAIDWENWMVKVVNEPQPFPAHLPVKRVSVNSFGYGGTNGHVIVESVDSFVPGYTHGKMKLKAGRGEFNQKRPYLLPFSAHDKPTLMRNIEAYKNIVGNYDLLDLSYTLANRRSKFSSRGFVVSNHEDVVDAFNKVGDNFIFAEKKIAPTIGFAFTGQGAQWARMGSELMAYYTSFLKTIRRLDQVLGDLPNGPAWTLEDELLRDASSSRVSDAEFSQPLCTAIQVALVDLLEVWGVKPHVTVGHSSGEIAAAYAAGLIGFNESIITAYFRGQVVKDIETNGAMMAVGLGSEGVQKYLAGKEDQVVVACHNSPALVTLSGDAPALEEVKSKLESDDIFTRYIKTSGKAYHSHHMVPSSAHYQALIREARRHVVSGIRKSTGALMVSSVFDTVLDPEKALDEYYWCENLVSPVKFNQAVKRIGTNEAFKKVDLLIEVGPHAALQGPIKQICREYGFDKLNYLPTLERGGDSASQLLKLAGQLFLRNYGLDLERIAALEQVSPLGKSSLKNGQLLVDLPTYQWNYSKDLWAEPRQSAEHRAPTHGRHDVLGGLLPGGSKVEPVWRNRLRIRDLPWLQHHSLGGEAVFPAAGYFGMAIEAVIQMNEGSANPIEITGFTLRDVSIKSALVTPDDDDGIETLFSLRPSVYSASDGIPWWDFNVSSCSQDGVWASHMTGTIGINARTRGQSAKVVPSMSQRATGKAWNQALKDVGFDYGPSFQDMEDIRTDGQQFHAASASTIKTVSGTMTGESRYVLHPATIDSCLQLIIVSIYAGRIKDMTCGAVPIQVDEVSIWPPTEEQLETPKAQAYAWTDQRGIRSFDSGTQLVANNGEVLLAISNMRCVAYEAAVPQKSDAIIKEQPFMELSWKVDIDSLSSKSPIEKLSTSDIVELVAFKNPGSKVLDLGAPNPVAICQKTAAISYTGTTPSQDAFEVLKLAISPYKQASALKIDLEQDFGDQGLTDQYDLVITGHFQDAVRLHSLLAPGGRVLAEARIAASLGDKFSIINLKNGMTLATAKDEKSTAAVAIDAQHSIAIVHRNSPTEVSNMVMEEISAFGAPRLAKLADADIGASERVVVLADLEGPLLATLEEAELAGLRHMVNNASSITWVSTGGLMKGNNPLQAMATGLARSVSSEMASLDFTVFDIDLKTTTSPSAVASHVSNLLSRQITKIKGKETEYCLEDGLVYCSRVTPLSSLNSIYGPQSSTVQSIPFTKDAKLVGQVQSGKLMFSYDARADVAIRHNEIQVKTVLSNLNKEGVLVLNGTDYPTTFSHEIYGVVTEVGSAVGDLKIGDEVVGFSFDKMATYQTVSADLVQSVIPGDIAEEVVTLPLAYATAMHGLNTLARVEPGESVLILHGTGSSGAAAITLCQIINAEVYVAVESEAEAAKVADQFDLPTENVIPVCDETVSTKAKELNGGCPIDVVYSSGFVSPTVAHECWREIAPFGRFIDIGRKNVLTRSALDSVPTHRGASYMAFDILDLFDQKPHLLSKYLRLTVTIYRQNTFKLSSTIQKKNITEVESAVATFTDNLTSPRTIIEYAESEGLLKILPHRDEQKFKADATYLLVGCLGGLGRSLTSWMMKRGAKRFAFMSRSGADKEEAALLIRDIEANGVICQIIKGDAANKKDVAEALRSIPASNPIRGVVQAAMVLRDGLFHSMSYDNWKASISPKVYGTANLQEALANTDLDFFVATSSTSGLLGTPGQANYAAANCFLDSLARHRVVNGKRATSLVLPMVQGVGVVAENPEIEAALRRKGIYGIDETHLLESFEAAMMNQTSTNPVDHVIVGMDPSKLQKSLSEADVTDGFWLEDARFKSILQEINATKGSDNDGAGFTILKAMCEAETPQKAISLISEHFTQKLSRLLLLDLNTFEPEVLPIAEYGLDSMIGAELRNWIFKEYAMDIPFQQLLGPSLTIEKFAGLVCANQGIK